MKTRAACKIPADPAAQKGPQNVLNSKIRFRFFFLRLDPAPLTEGIILKDLRVTSLITVGGGGGQPFVLYTIDGNRPTAVSCIK